MERNLTDEHTIDELLATNATAVAICRNCSTRAAVELEAMRYRYGGSVAMKRIALRIICTGCGAANCGLTISSPR